MPHRRTPLGGLRLRVTWASQVATPTWRPAHAPPTHRHATQHVVPHIHTPHKFNHVSHASLVRAMRNSLRECVPLMTKQWAKLYSGHSLRVGGSNHMRQLGVANDIHRRLGGWMSLTSAQGYMQLSAREQFRYSLRLAAEKRKSAFTKRRAMTVLHRMSSNLL